MAPTTWAVQSSKAFYMEAQGSLRECSIVQSTGCMMLAIEKNFESRSYICCALLVRAQNEIS